MEARVELGTVEAGETIGREGGRGTKGVGMARTALQPAAGQPQECGTDQAQIR
jgi:hypothetical protein